MFLHLQALAGVLAISFAAILVRLADVSAATAAFYRCLYATPVLVVLWYVRRRTDRRPRVSHFIGVAAGFVLFVDLALWHEAIGRIGAGLGTVLANTQVLFVGVAAWWLHGERPSRLSLVTIPVMLAGVALVSGLGRPDAYGADPIGGTMFGVLTGAAYAAYLLVFRAANPTAVPAVGPLAEATIGATIVAAALGPLVDPGFTWELSGTSHAWLVTLGIVAQVGGWLLIGTALPRLPALETSVMLLVQPVATMIWGYWLFGESMSAPQLGGVLLVLTGLAAVTALGGGVASRGRRPGVRTAAPDTIGRS